MSSAVDPGTTLNDCGCCEGVSGETPAEVVNRPGLSAIAYRVGTHAQFKETMLARLSGSGDRALAKLTTRDNDDFSIALLDAWATIDDVLTFYQERIANEAYLRTATERLSVLELARLIDYQLRPGVAASTYLAFALEEAPGALGQALSIGTTAQIAAEALPPIIIDVGTKVQSIPGSGEQAQTFETIEKIEARPEWNALKPRTTELIEPSFGDTSAYLKGISTNLKLGDILLFVGEERIKDPGSNRWDVRRIISVEPQPDAERTKVAWDKGLGSTSPRRESAENPKIFVLRQRASIFGFNAPDWRSMPDSFKENYLGISPPQRLTAENRKEWPDFKIYAPVYPSASQPAIQEEIAVEPTIESIAAAVTRAAEGAAKSAADNAAAEIPKATVAAAAAGVKAIHVLADLGKEGLNKAQTSARTIVDRVTSLRSSSLTADSTSGAAPVTFDAAFNEIATNLTAILKPFSIEYPEPPPSLGAETLAKALKIIYWPVEFDDRTRAQARDGIDQLAGFIKDLAKYARPTIAENPQLGAAINAAMGKLNDLMKALRDSNPLLFPLDAIGSIELGLPEESESILGRLADAGAHARQAADFADGAMSFMADAVGVGGVAAAVVLAVKAAAELPLPPGITDRKDFVVQSARTAGLSNAAVGEAVNKAIEAEFNRVTLHTRGPKSVLDHNTIDLDAVYQKITPAGWLVLSLPNDPDAKPSAPSEEFQQLFRVARVTEAARAAFSVSAKTTRIALEDAQKAHLDKFENDVRTTAVFAESEEIALAEAQLNDPVWKREIILDRRVENLDSARKLIITGKRVRSIKIGATPSPLFLTSERSFRTKQLKPGDVLFVLEPSAGTAESFIEKRWHVMDETGLKGYLSAPDTAVSFVESDQESARIVSEFAILDSAVPENRRRTKLILSESLKDVYDAETVVISANVASATHGETAQEVLGGGDATQAFQRFTLRQPPLTYVSASNPSGGQTTLEVRVNDVLWHEVPSFFDHSSEERIYVTRLDDEGKTTVIFGDGTTGARLPTGQENVKARYRKGIGLGGLVKADQLTQLITRPLGVTGVTNPIAAAGAADSERLDEARRNAPLTVLTLGRVVSLKDYEDFARSFSGIDKALATWSWFGEKRGVFVTVAGSKGAEVKDDSKLHDNLLKAMQNAGDPFLPLLVKSYQSRFFRLSAAIQVDPEFIPQRVLAAIEQKLRDNYSFDARAFGQPAHLSEVIGVMQNVRGVVAVDVNEFYRSDQAVDRKTRIAAAVPWPRDEEIFAAELLTLDPQPLDLEVSI